jgi:tetratricopeptide (TPR) repeat protein
MTRLLFISLLFVSCKGNTTQAVNAEAISYQVQVKQVQSDSLLVGIQGKIYNAFVQSLMSKDNNSLSKLSAKLEELNKTKKQNLILYWRSYLQFYSSIYYLKKGDNETAEKEIGKGIDWLKEMKKKNSEDYALLAMLQGFDIQFKGMKAMFISSDIKKNAKQAIAIDSTNLRAYYVYASNDFHTPEKYGGGKEAEEYLLKAVSLPSQKTKNEYLPSWGKEESYEMLIKLYIKREKWDLAKKYFQEGIKEFPESYTINQLASKLVGK